MSMRWERCLLLLLLPPRKSADFSVKKGKTNKWDKERKSKPSDASGTIALRNVYRGEEGGGREPRLIGGFEVNLLVNMYS